MTFTTVTFLIFFLIVFSCYWSIRRVAYQNAFIILAGYVFYGWWDWRFCGLMAFTSIWDFSIGYAIQRKQWKMARKVILSIGILVSLGLLGVFKYFNFFSENLILAANTLGWHLNPVTIKVVLPVGISFYTFQSISYVVDVYRGCMAATSSIRDYFAYVAFFPQLMAGPIERGVHLLPQIINPREFSSARAADGCRQILWGFAKKLLVADNLAPVVDVVYNRPLEHSGPVLVLATFAFAFQIYCDFSAYSDIAVGLARLLGIELMRNFSYPYFSQSMSEFWRRWHISLSSWFKDYVYFPLGGARAGGVRTGVNVMTTFLLSGLWHGASWNFVIWGALNGMAVLVESQFSRVQRLKSTSLPGGEDRFPKAGTIVRMLGVFSLISLTWVFFRADTFGAACSVISGFFNGWLDQHSYIALGRVIAESPLKGRVLWVVLGLITMEWIQREQDHPLHFEGYSVRARWIWYTIITIIILTWGAPSSGRFIYFQF